MDLYVLFGQRVCRYPGQYAPEALAIADEYTMEENPGYMERRRVSYTEDGDMESVAIVKICLSKHGLEDVRRALSPKEVPELRGYTRTGQEALRYIKTNGMTRLIVDGGDFVKTLTLLGAVVGTIGDYREATLEEVEAFRLCYRKSTRTDEPAFIFGDAGHGQEVLRVTKWDAHGAPSYVMAEDDVGLNWAPSAPWRAATIQEVEEFLITRHEYRKTT